MKDFLKVNYKYIIVIFIISLVMTFFMTKKEGFHEDEMFSYIHKKLDLIKMTSLFYHQNVQNNLLNLLELVWT